jgi:hypothetical protein
MSKKNKFDNLFNRQETDGEIPILSEEVVGDGSGEALPEIESQETDHISLKPIQDKSPIFVNANFSEEIIEIGYTFLATNEQNIVSASNGRLHLLQGRMYYIPINKDVDSDNYNIKVHSDAADRFDIRFIKDSLAAVVPIRHNAVLKNGERLCILTPLNC